MTMYTEQAQMISALAEHAAQQATQIVFMAFGGALLTGTIFFFVCWSIATSLQIFRK
jgi:hypothetical protein